MMFCFRGAGNCSKQTNNKQKGNLYLEGEVEKKNPEQH